MSNLVVVHIKKDPFDVRVDRVTKWGNPYRIGPDGTREDVVRNFYWWLFTSPEGDVIIRDIAQLRGLALGCWCAPKGGLPPALPPDAQCHAQILAWYANEE